MAETIVEKIPFDAKTGALMTPEAFEAYKAAKNGGSAATTDPTKTDPPKVDVKAEPPVNTEGKVTIETKKVDQAPAKTDEVKVTNKEAKDAGTTKDAIQEFFNSELKEKYGVETKEQLLELLSDAEKLADELETTRKGAIKFKNEKQKATYEFLKEYEDMEDGLEVAARLIKMDPDNMNDRKAMEQRFILENGDMAREDAVKLFDRSYRKKYESLKKEDFESDVDFEDEKAGIELERKKEAAQAKKYLKGEQVKVKALAQERKEQSSTKQELQFPTEQANAYLAKNDELFREFQGISYEGEGHKITYKFTGEEREWLKNSVEDYVKNPNSYKDGKIANFDAQKIASTIAWGRFGSKIMAEAVKQIDTIASTKKAEQIAQVQPDKVSKSNEGGEIKGDMSFLGQAERAAEQKKAQRQNQPRVKPPLPAG